MKTFLNSRRKHSTLHRCDSGPCLWYLGVLPSSLTRPFLFENFLFHFLFLFFFRGVFSTVGSLLTHSFCCMLKLFFFQQPKREGCERQPREEGGGFCHVLLSRPANGSSSVRVKPQQLESGGSEYGDCVWSQRGKIIPPSKSRDTVWMGRVRDGRGSGSTPFNLATTRVQLTSSTRRQVSSN